MAFKVVGMLRSTFHRPGEGFDCTNHRFNRSIPVAYVIVLMPARLLILPPAFVGRHVRVGGLMRPIFSQVLGLEVYCALNCNQACNFNEILSFH
jgi:hypothetical protein